MTLPVNQLLLGDSREVLRTLPDSSVDSVVTDPPAGIEFMGNEWDNPDKFGATFQSHGYSDGGERVSAPIQRLSVRNPNCRKCRKHIRGANGCRCEVPDSDEDPSFLQSQRLRQRDGFVQFMREIMRECYRVLKPGGHALVWSLPRTSHWTATALEEAGFEIRDSLMHAKDRTPDVEAFLSSLSDAQRELLVRAEETSGVMAQVFGSGFPKSHNVSKAIDKLAGAERRVIRSGIGFDASKHKAEQFTSVSFSNVGVNSAAFRARIGEVTEPATPEAKKWDGWGTVLKPAYEAWWLVRKPIEAKSTALQVLATGTGAINIDGCRISTEDTEGLLSTPSSGRWPANFLLSHGPDCRQVGTQEVVSPVINRFVDGMKPFGEGAGHAYESVGGGTETVAVYECAESCPVRLLDRQTLATQEVGVGGASRFFATFTPDLEAPFVYAKKASRSDKNADLEEAGLINNHPTVKGQGLMTYLVRLVTPPGGIVLDPFAGSGSTLVAAVTEGFNFIGIEREPEYHAIASQRVEKAFARTQEQKTQKELFGFMGELSQE